MANSYIVFALCIVSASLISIQADETTIDDIIQSSIDSTVGSTLGELEALTRLTGAGGSYRHRYTPLPYRNYGSGLNLLGGSTHIRNLPDLVNFVFGLGGHVVGRAGWIVHDAFKSLFDGMLTSRFKLRSPAAHNMFGHWTNHDDGFDDDDLGLGSLGLGGLGGLGGLSGLGSIANPDIYGGVLSGNDLLDINFW